MSHRKAIESYLSQNKHRWVSLPELSEYTAQKCKSRCYVVHSRIAEVRRDAIQQGFRLDNKTEQKNGVTMSYYMLTNIS